jgi:hypothetical protein
MGFSIRLLVVDHTDRIHRLDVDRFSQMRHEPKAHPFVQFAGQRLRWAEAVVELVEQKPLRVLRMTFNILPFDQAGCFDTETFDRHMLGRANLAFSSPSELVSRTQPDSEVFDAGHLFADRGARWVPSKPMLRALHEAALGGVKLPWL